MALNDTPDLFSISVERRDADLWVITSPQIRGLLVAEASLTAAMTAAGQALVDLEMAEPLRELQ